MDILYVIGRGSQHDNIELRWSLRSIEKYGMNVGRVVVAGYPPEWLSNEVVALPVDDLPTAGYKHVNIMYVIKVAILEGAVEGDFLYSSDDHFITKETDFGDYPFYYKREKIRNRAEYFRDSYPWKKYQQSMANTRKLLEAAGLDPREWSGHVNTHMHSADLLRVQELVECGVAMGIGRLGFEPTCLYMAARNEREPVEAVFRDDKKMGREFDMGKIASDGSFTIGDRTFDDYRLIEFMNCEFGGKSRYENSLL